MSLKQSSSHSENTAGHSRARRWFQLLLDTVGAFWADDCYTKAAALSYYAVLSVLPLLIVLLAGATWIASRTMPEFDVTAAMIGFVERFSSPEIAAWVRNTLPTLEQQTALLSGINLLILIWSAANIFRQLNVSINAIWAVYDQTGAATDVRAMAKWYIHDQYRSFLLLLAALGLFFLDSTLRLVLFVLREYLSALPIAEQWRSKTGSPLVDATVFILDVVALALLYRYFPPARIPWRAVMPGAILGAVLIVAAGFVLGFMVSGLFAGIYAALGGPIALMLWVNMVGQSILLGCELTRQCWLLFCGGEHAIAAMPEMVA